MVAYNRQETTATADPQNFFRSSILNLKPNVGPYGSTLIRHSAQEVGRLSLNWAGVANIRLSTIGRPGMSHSPVSTSHSTSVRSSADKTNSTTQTCPHLTPKYQRETMIKEYVAMTLLKPPIISPHFSKPYAGITCNGNDSLVQISHQKSHPFPCVQSDWNLLVFTILRIRLSQFHGSSSAATCLLGTCPRLSSTHKLHRSSDNLERSFQSPPISWYSSKTTYLPIPLLHYQCGSRNMARRPVPSPPNMFGLLDTAFPNLARGQCWPLQKHLEWRCRHFQTQPDGQRRSFRHGWIASIDPSRYRWIRYLQRLFKV